MNLYEKLQEKNFWMTSENFWVLVIIIFILISLFVYVPCGCKNPSAKTSPVAQETQEVVQEPRINSSSQEVVEEINQEFPTIHIQNLNVRRDVIINHSTLEEQE